MDRLFDFKSKEQEPSQNDLGDKKLSLEYLKLHQRRIANIRQLSAAPKPDELVFLFTDRSFNAFTFIPYLLDQFECIEDLRLSTFSISKRIVGSFARLLEIGAIKRARLVVADSLKHQRPDVVQLLESMCKRFSNLEVQYSWNHSKILIARAGKGYYVIEGSGNWSENARHEQYLFANSEKLYHFRAKCLDKVERR